MTQQCDTAARKITIFQAGTRLPRVHSQPAKAGALSAAPEPEEILCSEGIAGQVKAALATLTQPGSSSERGLREPRYNALRSTGVS